MKMEKKQRKGGRKTALRRACENSYGYFDATPGTDLASRLQHVSEGTISRYVRAGWLEKVGTGLVLTQAGYREI